MIGFVVADLEQVVAALPDLGHYVFCSSAAVYGDLDFIVLGAVVEAVAHRRLDEFCAERIFGPLDMKDTFFVPGGEGVTGSPLPDALRRRVAATESCPWIGSCGRSVRKRVAIIPRLRVAVHAA